MEKYKMEKFDDTDVRYIKEKEEEEEEHFRASNSQLNEKIHLTPPPRISHSPFPQHSKKVYNAHTSLPTISNNNDMDFKSFIDNECVALYSHVENTSIGFSEVSSSDHKLNSTEEVCSEGSKKARTYPSGDEIVQSRHVEFRNEHYREDDDDEDENNDDNAKNVVETTQNDTLSMNTLYTIKNEPGGQNGSASIGSEINFHTRTEMNSLTEIKTEVKFENGFGKKGVGEGEEEMVFDSNEKDSTRSKKGKKEEEDCSKQKVHPCKICGKCFLSGRALGGHMRSHTVNSNLVNIHGFLHCEGRKGVGEETMRGSHGVGMSMSLEKHHHLHHSHPPHPRLFNCKVCGRGFESGRALGGHMRTHRTYALGSVKLNPEPIVDIETEEGEYVPETTEKGVVDVSMNEEDENENDDERKGKMKQWNLLTAMAADDKERKKGRKSSYNSEEVEMADCLVLLSHSVQNEENGKTKTKMEMKTKKSKGKEECEEMHSNRIKNDCCFKTKMDASSSSYSCSICLKMFSSHQALGGHCSSHSKSKLHSLLHDEKTKERSGLVRCIGRAFFHSAKEEMDADVDDSSAKEPIPSFHSFKIVSITNSEKSEGTGNGCSRSSVQESRKNEETRIHGYGEEDEKKDYKIMTKSEMDDYSPSLSPSLSDAHENGENNKEKGEGEEGERGEEKEELKLESEFFVFPNVNNEPKSHVCSICERNFASGQALGGHKRRHWYKNTRGKEENFENFENVKQEEEDDEVRTDVEADLMQSDIENRESEGKEDIERVLSMAMKVERMNSEKDVNEITEKRDGEMGEDGNEEKRKGDEKGKEKRKEREEEEEEEELIHEKEDEKPSNGDFIFIPNTHNLIDKLSHSSNSIPPCSHPSPFLPLPLLPSASPSPSNLQQLQQQQPNYNSDPLNQTFYNHRHFPVYYPNYNTNQVNQLNNFDPFTSTQPAIPVSLPLPLHPCSVPSSIDFSSGHDQSPSVYMSPYSYPYPYLYPSSTISPFPTLTCPRIHGFLPPHVLSSLGIMQNEKSQSSNVHVHHHQHSIGDSNMETKNIWNMNDGHLHMHHFQCQYPHRHQNRSQDQSQDQERNYHHQQQQQQQHQHQHHPYFHFRAS